MRTGTISPSASPTVPTPMAGAVRAALLVLGLTAAHHAYGAAIYAAAFRLHMVFVSIAVGGLILLTARLSLGRRPSVASTARLVLAAVIIVFPVAMIGLYEGLYNHVVKDMAFLLGVYERVAPQLFPPPLYERPSDLLFEGSGILQFPAALWTARQLSRWHRAGSPADDRARRSGPQGRDDVAAVEAVTSGNAGRPIRR